MLSAKIVIMGPPASGCREMLATLARGTGATAGASGERALEFRRWEVSPDVRIQFYGVVAHPTLEFAWPTICKGLSGAVVTCDAAAPALLEHTRHVVDFLTTSFRVPVVVAVGEADQPQALSLVDIRQQVQVPEEVAVVPCRFQNWDSVKQALMVLFYAIRARIDDERGRAR
jgi:signal recognition particle receptor subunit beta